jgi:hypothetical protein
LPSPMTPIFATVSSCVFRFLAFMPGFGVAQQLRRAGTSQHRLGLFADRS